MEGMMKGVTVLGAVLIILGILGFVFGGISFTKKDKVADLGPIELQKEKMKLFPLHQSPPVWLWLRVLYLLLPGLEKGEDGRWLMVDGRWLMGDG
jgi:hypothetical protein